MLSSTGPINPSAVITTSTTTKQTEVEIGGGMINISDNNSYGNNANDDQVLLQQDQDHDHHVDLSACFEPSDYLSYDYFGPFHGYVDVEDLESTFQAFIYGSK
ncbi:unnamed protein product [Amaranthus hypochondriacus]